MILTPEEVRALSGGYSQPSRQLKELHALGYWRARRSKITGEVIVERDHVAAVSAGATAPTRYKAKAENEPTLRAA